MLSSPAQLKVYDVFISLLRLFMNSGLGNRSVPYKLSRYSYHDSIHWNTLNTNFYTNLLECKYCWSVVTEVRFHFLMYSYITQNIVPMKKIKTQALKRLYVLGPPKSGCVWNFVSLCAAIAIKLFTLFSLCLLSIYSCSEQASHKIYN